MENKVQYCRKILEVYGILVDFEGDVGRKNVPSPAKDETVAKWKKRVLGEQISDVHFYVPFNYHGRTKIDSLRAESYAEHISDLVSKTVKDKQKKLVEQINSQEDTFADKLKVELETQAKSYERKLKQLEYNQSSIVDAEDIKDLLDRKQMDPEVKAMIINNIDENEDDLLEVIDKLVSLIEARVKMSPYS